MDFEITTFDLIWINVSAAIAAVVGIVWLGRNQVDPAAKQELDHLFCKLKDPVDH